MTLRDLTLSSQSVCSQCGSELLSSVDNYAVLQLDVVWCYQALEALGCLQDGRARLQRAEEAFHRCYGEMRQRLLRIQVLLEALAHGHLNKRQ